MDDVARERTNYFDGQLLSADDLAQEQLYFREKARRHNRTLHGWGVVSGLEVTSGTGRLEVLVGPGYALDPHGEEIAVESEVAVDLCKEDRGGIGVLPCDSEDDESKASVERLPGQHVYVAVRYAECYSRPVRMPDGSEEASAYSRVREGFSIAPLTELPASSVEPWVVLADVTVGSRGEVANIDSVTHRHRLSNPG